MKSVAVALAALAHPVLSSKAWEGEWGKMMNMHDQNISISGSGAAHCPGSISNGEKCALDGSDNYNNVELAYDDGTGVFTGSITTNLCSNDQYGYCELCDPPGYTGHQHTAQCTQQALPAPAYKYGESEERQPYATPDPPPSVVRAQARVEHRSVAASACRCTASTSTALRRRGLA